MANFPKSLSDKLHAREANHALRRLPQHDDLVDFSSNDYLGFSRSAELFNSAHQFLVDNKLVQNGATGSRLISGNYPLCEKVEKQIAEFHGSESALIFNSGYDANIGFFSAVPQRNDVILFDELAHASIRDGIRLSAAKSYKFAHNDLEELEQMILKYRDQSDEIYLATESVFSMDGDSPNLEHLVAISTRYKCRLIMDEAHALGVFGPRGEGLTQPYREEIFARVVTFGKGLGCHGAAVLGCDQLKTYLVNFARSFIYTTGLPPHSLAMISGAYKMLEADEEARMKLRNLISFFNQEKMRLGLKPLFVYGKSAIQSAIIPGNERVKSVADALQEKGFSVKAILSPTVPESQERLRICIHNYNSEEQITKLLSTLAEHLF